MNVKKLSSLNKSTEVPQHSTDDENHSDFKEIVSSKNNVSLKKKNKNNKR